ncbi:unnamed protein product, partial [Ectocarpus fasciculatus]
AEPERGRDTKTITHLPKAHITSPTLGGICPRKSGQAHERKYIGKNTWPRCACLHHTEEHAHNKPLTAPREHSPPKTQAKPTRDKKGKGEGGHNIHPITDPLSLSLETKPLDYAPGKQLPKN